MVADVIIHRLQFKRGPKVGRFLLNFLYVLMIVRGISGSTTIETSTLTTTTTTSEVDETEENNLEEEMDLPTVPLTAVVMQANIKMSDVPDVDEPTGVPDINWDAKKVIRDVGYFLRHHKFQDYDRRYYQRAEDSPSRLYEEFPKPALRSLHWEVRRHCDVSFVECLKYAARVAESTAQRRELDAATIVNAEKWSYAGNNAQILAAQNECQMAQRRDNLTMTPFQGPIERFQWRTSVSYYMCWYTMLGVPELEAFGESCDNHANCLDAYGPHNRDPRADDAKPFGCALYSFCPDPCCPMKHLWYMNDCFQSPENPCYADAHAGSRKCGLNREENQDFRSLLANQINLTCECHEAGFEWSSRFGLCVDVNECATGKHNCTAQARQTCVNLPGSYDCVCRFGFVFDEETKKCVKNRGVSDALQDSLTMRKNRTDKESAIASIFDKIARSSGIYYKAMYMNVLLLASVSNFLLVDRIIILSLIFFNL